MSEWTPTTEQVRSGFASDPEGEYRDPINAASNQRWAEKAFDRWLADHDERVKAEAKAEVLEEAAREWAADPDAWGDNDKDFRNELRDRAAAIRAAAENGETNDPEV